MGRRTRVLAPSIDLGLNPFPMLGTQLSRSTERNGRDERPETFFIACRIGKRVVWFDDTSLDRLPHCQLPLQHQRVDGHREGVSTVPRQTGVLPKDYHEAGEAIIEVRGELETDEIPSSR